MSISPPAGILQRGIAIKEYTKDIRTKTLNIIVLFMYMIRIVTCQVKDILKLKVKVIM